MGWVLDGDKSFWVHIYFLRFFNKWHAIFYGILLKKIRDHDKWQKVTKNSLRFSAFLEMPVFRAKFLVFLNEWTSGN